MKISKRILSLLLCAVMVLGTVAVGGEGFAEVLGNMLGAFSVKASADYGTDFDLSSVLIPVDEEQYADEFDIMNYLTEKFHTQNGYNVIGNYYNTIDKTSLCGELWNNYSLSTSYLFSTTAWELATFDFDSLFVGAGGNILERKDFYESIIFNILNITSESKGILNWITQSKVKNTLKVTKLVADICKEEKILSLDTIYGIELAGYGRSELLQQELDRQLKKSLPAEVSSGISKVSEIVSDASTMKNLIENLILFLQVSDLNKYYVDILKEMKNNTDDNALKQAIEDVIGVCNNATNSLFIGIRDGVISYLNTTESNLSSKYMKQLVKSFSDSTIMNAVFIAQSIGKSVSNMCFSTDKLTEQVSKMACLYRTQLALRNTLPHLYAKNDYSIVFAVQLILSITDLDNIYATEFIKTQNSQLLLGLSAEEYNNYKAYIDSKTAAVKAQFNNLLPIGLESCGTNLYWAIADGRLIIYGMGDMSDFSSENLVPWSEYKSEISLISVSSLCTKIGKYAFSNMNVSGNLYLHSVSKISSFAFDNCFGLNSIVFYCNISVSKLNIEDHTSVFCCGTLTGNDFSLGAASHNYILGDFVARGSISFYNSVLVVGGNFDFPYSTESSLLLEEYTVFTVLGSANMVSHDPSASFQHINSTIEICENCSFNIKGNAKIRGDYWGYDTGHCVNTTINGTLCVDGDLSLGGTNVYHKSTFKFSGENSLLKVGGNFSLGDGISFSASDGTLVFSKNISGGIKCGANSTVILNGTDVQTIGSSCTFSTLIINNTVNVKCNAAVYVTDGLSSKVTHISTSNLFLKGGKIIGDKYYGNLGFSGTNTIDDSVTIEGNISFQKSVVTDVTITNNSTVKVTGNGDFGLADPHSYIVSYLKIDSGSVLDFDGNVKMNCDYWGYDTSHCLSVTLNGELLIGGDLNIGGSLCYHKGSFNMNNPGALLKIGGNFNISQNIPISISSGNIEVAGNVIVNSYGILNASNTNVNLKFCGSCTVNGTLSCNGCTVFFSGDKKQSISGMTSFTTVVIENNSNEGVIFNKAISVSNLFNHNGKKFSAPSGSKFVDFDGDSLKDNEDPMPTVYNTNWITWVSDSSKLIQAYNPGDTIIPPSFSKTGYSFAGWDNDIPQTMPDSQLTFNALWNINTYCITWDIGSKKTYNYVKYNSKISVPTNPTREGYVFAGWMPAVLSAMPAYDLEYTAQWARTVTWEIDEKITKVNYIPGSVITIPEAEKYGYSFVGWDNQIPEVMPDENLTFIAEFEVNNHQVEWVIGDNIITETYNFGEIIVPPEAEIIDGYVFEWVPDYPATMPDEDLVIYAKWYKIITWIIDNDTIISKYEPGDKIMPPEIPLKDGYTVNGWSSDVPEIMPDKDLTFEAVYSDFATEAVDSSLKIIGYSGSEYEIVIPDSIGGYSVTAIGDNAFNCTAETIVIPASITTISGTAFKNVSGLQSIEVDEANEYYSSADGVLFNKDKTSLIHYPSGKPETEYSIPSTVTGIGQYAFYKCDNLSSVIIPNNVKTIGTYAFAYCNGIITLTIGEGITSIGNYAFKSCTSLDTLYYNAISCQSTGTYNILSSQNAFNSCSALKNVIIGNKVERIPNAFLAGITGVSEIIIPDNVIEIGIYSFYGCKGLKNITLSNSLKSIGNYAFYNCTFTNIELTDSVESIGTYTFANCTGLTNITIPTAVTSIGVSAFNGCSKLISITVDNENETYMSSDGVLFSNDGTNLIRCPVGKSGVYTVPDEVTTVGTYCFTGCKNLTVACKEGSPAHSFCVTNSIKYTFISSATNYSTNNKFAYNGHLYEIYNNEKSWKDAKAICEMLGGHLVTITASGEQTQVKNSITNGGKDYYWIGASDESSEGTWVWINGEPFSYTNWNSGEPNNSNSKEHFAEIIKSDGLWNDSPFDSASRGFICEYDECEIDFDFVEENNQITITGYNGNESDVIIPDTILGLPVTSINGTFSGCKFESVTLGVNVNTLSASAFSTCVTLQNIFVDDNNSTFVSENGILYSFDKTTIIKYPSAKSASYYSLPKSVTKINDYAFYNVASLKSINLSNVTRIEQYAFSNSGLTTATIPEGMEYLGKAAFYGCTDLTDVFFNAVNCTSGYAPTIYILITKTSLIFDSTVKNVVFGDNVSVISSGLFTNVSLPKLYIPKSVKEIKACAFYYNSALTDVYYSGTEAEWNSVTKGNYAFGTSNKYLQSATMHYGEYSAAFIIDGKIVSQTGFTQGSTLEEPSIPAKQGYAYSMWYPYNTNANKNINIVARYELPKATLIAQKTLFEGDNYRLISSSNYTTSKKEWRSSDTRVAIVDSSGKVTAIGEGECKIYVTCYGNDLTGEPISSTSSTTIIVVSENDTKEIDAKNNFKAGFEKFFHYMLNDIVETIKMIFRYLTPFIPAK